jgi:hypothetical protein
METRSAHVSCAYCYLDNEAVSVSKMRESQFQQLYYNLTRRLLGFEPSIDISPAAQKHLVAKDTAVIPVPTVHRQPISFQILY